VHDFGARGVTAAEIFTLTLFRRGEHYSQGIFRRRWPATASQWWGPGAGPGSRWRPSDSSTPSHGSTAVACFGVHPTLFHAVGPPAVDRQTRTGHREIL